MIDGSGEGRGAATVVILSKARAAGEVEGSADDEVLRLRDPSGRFAQDDNSTRGDNLRMTTSCMVTISLQECK